MSHLALTMILALTYLQSDDVIITALIMISQTRLEVDHGVADISW